MMRARPFNSAGENEPPSLACPRMVWSGRFHGVRSALGRDAGGRSAVCAACSSLWGARTGDTRRAACHQGGRPQDDRLIRRRRPKPQPGALRQRDVERRGGTRSAASGASQPRMRSRPTRLTVAAAAAMDTIARPPLRPKPASSRPRIVSPSAPPPCAWRRASMSNQVALSAATAVTRQTDGRRRRASIQVSQPDQAGTSGAPGRSNHRLQQEAGRAHRENDAGRRGQGDQRQRRDDPAARRRPALEDSGQPIQSTRSYLARALNNAAPAGSRPRGSLVRLLSRPAP